MYFVHTYDLHVYITLVNLDSVHYTGVCPTPELTSSTPGSVRVCTRVYTHTRTYHRITRKNRDIYNTDPLSLPLPKHSSLHQ